MTEEEQAELNILKCANDAGKFAIPVDEGLPDLVQQALERGMHLEWYRLVDVATIAAAGGRLCRVFILTAAGRNRLFCLTELAA